jgi:hypothetical protein
MPERGVPRKAAGNENLRFKIRFEFVFYGPEEKSFRMRPLTLDHRHLANVVRCPAISDVIKNVMSDISLRPGTRWTAWRRTRSSQCGSRAPPACSSPGLSRPLLRIAVCQPLCSESAPVSSLARRGSSPTPSTRSEPLAYMLWRLRPGAARLSLSFAPVCGSCVARGPLRTRATAFLATAMS